MTNFNLLLAVYILMFHIYYILSGRIGKVVASHVEGCKVDSHWGCADTMHEMLRGYCSSGWGGATSQLDLPSLMPFIAGCV